MKRVDDLTLRTTRALGRLASLQRRAGGVGTPGIVRDALDELSAVLEDLRAANEKLVEQASEIAAARQRSERGRRDFQALFDAMSTPCVFTDATGRILDANPPASRLLNVGRQHLAGKPLFLFFTSRDRFLAALEPPAAEQFEKLSIVRPRERRPREVLVRGVRLPDDQRWCWFLDAPPGATASQSEGDA
jgi:PAS domain-containing protein